MSSIARGSMPGHLLDLLNISESQWQRPENLLCKWFKGQRSVLRGEFQVRSLIWCLRQSQKPPRGLLDLWFPQDKTRGNVLIFFEAERAYSWRRWERYFRTPSPQAASQYLAATKRHHMPGWGEVKSLQRWHTHLSHNFRSVTSQSKHQNFKTSDSTRDDKECQTPHKRAFSTETINVPVRSDWGGELHPWHKIYRPDNISLSIKSMHEVCKGMQTVMFFSVTHNCEKLQIKQSMFAAKVFKINCHITVGKKLHDA